MIKKGFCGSLFLLCFCLTNSDLHRIIIIKGEFSMIIYFSGTGNGRFIANNLAAYLDDEAVNSVDYILGKKSGEFYSQKPYVFVAPVYAWRMPRIFDQFIRENSFGGDKRAYFILNCGSEMDDSARYVKKLASEKGFDYMGTAEVIMPENYVVMFDTPTEDEVAETIAKARIRVKKLAEQILSGGVFSQPKVFFAGKLRSGMVNGMFYTFTVTAKPFRTTDACIGCGKCTEVCVTNNIRLADGKPYWGKTCVHCMACLHHCPTEAIEYGRHSVGRRRYICPEEK